MKLYETMDHRGGLTEALKTRKSIDPFLAKYLIEIGIYKEYDYDERIKANRYIFKGMPKNWTVPTWLLEFDEREIK